MNEKELNDRLKVIRIEDYIWIIYIFIIIFSLYSNVLERDYFINNNIDSKNKYQEITTNIFIILLIIYIYFAVGSYNDLKKLSDKDSEQKKKLAYLSFIASVLVLISGILFLYISVNNENLDIETAFN